VRRLLACKPKGDQSFVRSLIGELAGGFQAKLRKGVSEVCGKGETRRDRGTLVEALCIYIWGDQPRVTMGFFRAKPELWMTRKPDQFVDVLLMMWGKGLQVYNSKA
jgi:hypothetical protein